MLAKEPIVHPARRNRALRSRMSEMHGSDPGVMALWTAAIGLAVFICGFGSGSHRNDDFRGAFLVGLAGAVLFIAGIAALAPIALHDV